MRKFCFVVFGLAIGFALAWGAINFHVFRTPDGIVVAVKRSPTLADTYVDVRHWGLVQWSEFPDLAWSLARSGHADVVRSRAIYETAQNVEVDVSR
jgi:hypothetical protein